MTTDRRGEELPVRREAIDEVAREIQVPVGELEELDLNRSLRKPAALHRAESDLPFVTFFEGLDFQLLQASVENGLWVVRTRFQPNVSIATHRHTGEAFVVTFTGS